jgi:N-carbamoylputrescine amidase
MATPRPQTLTVAALQLNSANDDVAGNLARAVPHLEAAASAGARLILLPELYSSGYVFERGLWRAAERLADGPTRTWLSAHAARLGAHIGTTILEARALRLCRAPAAARRWLGPACPACSWRAWRAAAARSRAPRRPHAPQQLPTDAPARLASQARGQHFFNTFLLAAPDGTLAGVVRKQTPAALEAFLFAPGEPRGPGSHVFACPLLGGLRVAVGICYENHLDYLARYAAAEDADLVLMPHSACRCEGVPAGVVAAYEATLLRLPPRTAAALRVPVVMANKSGPWRSSFLGSRLMLFEAGFPGLSTIVDGGGAVLAPPTSRENVVLCATVTIPPPGTARAAAAAALPPASAWRKFSPMAQHPRTLRVLFAIDEALGAVVYRLSRERRAAALAASHMTADAQGSPPLHTQLHPAMLAGAAALAALATGALAARVMQR